MAITDILDRIGSDGAAEAAELMDAAKAEAARITAEAEATLAHEREALLNAAKREAAEDAATILANARLSARDSLLNSKRALAEQVLDRAQTALESLPDAEYLELMARAAAIACEAGQTLAIAPADTKRLAKLDARLRDLGCELGAADAPAPIGRGALLAGDRVRTEISPASLVADRRDELLLAAARVLFGEGE